MMMIGEPITFNRSNQKHQTLTKDSFTRQEPTSNFELFLKNESATKVFYIDGKKTFGLDPVYDSKMFDGASYDFAVFTELVSDNG